ncbi:S-adenosylmethionine decarboxylase [Mucilaginibacter sp. BJC16-A38]|uniref:S-adenosylmethionine decarboxylase family protein n=1 Tax=Mucilaginibacter phenanthrenivorans TaxID=1234842 RepID=UPI0021571E0C|nr:S-adenosylmethionine decarboxylase [Mucilaginibacter phenanthrenivorans]MCR8560364.1 S-adenosylmethionine decarboxylase [Mucilaginibacter phenanthrenivorans]
MPYTPGLHIISEFTSEHNELLSYSLKFRDFLNDEISRQELTKVGEVWHDFPGGGFTAVVCLTESHISIHTWPEHKLATFDVFLSNYQQVNDGKARAIYDNLLSFYEGAEIQKNEIKR